MPPPATSVVGGGGISLLCFRRVDRVGLARVGVDLVKSSSPIWRNKSAAPSSPCRCCWCRHAGGVACPLIYGSSGGLVPRSVGGSGGFWDDFGPRGSLDRTSSCFLQLVDVAATATWSCEYLPPLPLRRGAGDLPIGGAEAGSRCACGDGSLDLLEASSATATSPVCWSSVAEVGDFPTAMAVYTMVLAPGVGAAAAAARPQPAPASVFFFFFFEMEHPDSINHTGSATVLAIRTFTSSGKLSDQTWRSTWDCAPYAARQCANLLQARGFRLVV